MAILNSVFGVFAVLALLFGAAAGLLWGGVSLALVVAAYVLTRRMECMRRAEQAVEPV